jgi:dipeptidyl aminopeptidase/acylaminoacyl peptidase
MAIRPDGQGARKIGDTPGTLTGCNGSTADPAEQLYWSETGLAGNGLLLAWARTGKIYFSLGCDGTGVGQLDAGGAGGGILNTMLRRAHLSPDGAELLGIVVAANADRTETPTLVRLRPQDGSTTTLTTAAPPDQVSWSADGKSIYYSTATLKDTVTLDDPQLQERGTKVFGVWPFQTRIYDVTLHRIDLTSGVDAPVYGAVGRGIGHIAPSPDGAGVLFTLVKDASELVEAFKSNVSAGDLRREAPSIGLYWLPLPDGQAQLLAITSDPTWGPLGSADAPTPTSGPKQSSPTPRPVVKVTTTPTAPSLPPPTNTRLPGATATG